MPKFYSIIQGNRPYKRVGDDIISCFLSAAKYSWILHVSAFNGSTQYHQLMTEYMQRFSNWVVHCFAWRHYLDGLWLQFTHCYIIVFYPISSWKVLLSRYWVTWVCLSGSIKDNSFLITQTLSPHLNTMICGRIWMINANARFTGIRLSYLK